MTDSQEKVQNLNLSEEVRNIWGRLGNQHEPILLLFANTRAQLSATPCLISDQFPSAWRILCHVRYSPSVHVTCCVSMLCLLPHLIARSLCEGGSRPIGSHLSFLIMASTIVRTLCPHEDTAPSLVNTGDSIRGARHVCALPWDHP